MSLLSLAAITSCGGGGNHQGHPATGVVPSLIQPTPRHTAYPTCSAVSLLAHPRTWGPAGGTVYDEIRITNRSNHSCTLTGGPARIVGVRYDGRLATLVRGYEHGVGFNLKGPGPANLLPGESGWLTLSWGDNCKALVAGRTERVRSVFIHLSQGGAVSVALPHSPNVVCGMFASRFGEAR